MNTKENSSKTEAGMIGALFIIELVVYMIGSTLVEVILNTSDFLIELATNKNQIITGVLIEAICAACLVTIAALMYPILKKHSQTLALGYFGLRIVETVFTIGFLVIHLLALTLSLEYVKTGSTDISQFQTLGALLKEGLGFTYQIYIIFYSLGCLILFGLLFKAILVPRFISILGMMAVLFSLTGLVFDMFGFNIGVEVYAMPLAICQVLLSIRLIIKGFNSSEVAAVTFTAA